MLTYEVIGALIGVAAVIVAGMYAFYRVGLDIGYENGAGDVRAEIQAERAGKRAQGGPGRHRASQPRAWPSPAPAAVPPDSKPVPVTQPSGGAIGYMVARFAAARPAVDTVLLAPQPSPALTGAADTGTMTKVRLSDAPDTGEMRAVTDAWIAENIHPEAVL